MEKSDLERVYPWKDVSDLYDSLPRMRRKYFSIQDIHRRMNSGSKEIMLNMSGNIVKLLDDSICPRWHRQGWSHWVKVVRSLNYIFGNLYNFEL